MNRIEILLKRVYDELSGESQYEVFEEEVHHFDITARYNHRLSLGLS